MQKINIRLVFKILVLLLVVALIFGGYFWWQHSDIVTYTEYNPTDTSAGLKLLGAHIEVYSTRASKGSKLSKYLVLDLGPTASLTESDESVYAKRVLGCGDSFKPDCFTLEDNKGNIILVNVVRPATNLPPTGQSIECIIHKTVLSLQYQSDTLLTDQQIKSFFSSMQPYKFSHIQVIKK